MLLKDKNVVVTGVLNEASIAFAVARQAQEEGANVVLTSFGRALSITERVSRRLPVEAPVLALDVTDADDLAALAGRVANACGPVDGILHAVAYAPPACLGDDFLAAGWDDVAVALRVSAYSLKALVEALLPVVREDGASVVGLDFDAGRAWPSYSWMGVAKAGLESVTRYLARQLGPRRVRVNLVAAGPVRTLAAGSIPGFDRFESTWSDRAPLGWEVADPTPVARACVALLSDLFPATTGELVHVDGGFHAVGA
jgi:enoyl ACP reductase